MAALSSVVLPGDVVPQHTLPVPTGKKKTLTLGPGLRHIPPSTISATIAGALATDSKKNAAWVESNTGRYLPATGDLVIATVQGSTMDNFNCTLTPNTPFATLPLLAFEGVTRKTRPILPSNTLVYARITSAGKDTPPELTCVEPSTGKGDGLGPVKGGMVFNVSLGMARRLLAGTKGGVVLPEVLGERVGFEMVVGRNGVVVVDAGSVKATLAVGRALQEVDEKALGVKDQKKLAEKVVKAF